MPTGIFIDCPTCKKSVEAPETKAVPSFVNEYGQWSNYNFECPECAKNNQKTFHMINLNIPASEFDPQEIEEEIYFPKGELEKRNAIRNLMWQIRPDLRGRDRAAFDKERRAESEKKFGKSIEAIREERKRMKEEQTAGRMIGK